MDVNEYLRLDAEARRLPVDPDAPRLFKAFMLAPRLEICEALLAGERVPWWRLDFDEARRFKLRPGRERLERLSLEDFNDVRG
jgi:hypothetical protein